MTSSHRHSTTQKAVVAGTIDQDLAALTARVAALENAAKPPSPVYTFADEFDTLSPKWVPLYGPGDPGDRLDTDCGNMGLTQVSVANSILTIACERKPTPSGRPFAGAAIATYGTFSQKYGTWETRMRYDAAKGTWPSLFLFPPGQKGPFPEVDWIEAYGDAACLDPAKHENVVYGAAGGPSKYAVVGPITNPRDWHDYKMVWTSSAIEFFCDGVSTFKVTDPAYVPQTALYPIYVFGVGANNPACRADATTPNRLTLQIDWFRVTA